MRYSLLEEIIESIYLILVAVCFISLPIVFYVLGLTGVLKEEVSLWWLLGLPSLLFVWGWNIHT